MSRDATEPPEPPQDGTRRGPLPLRRKLLFTVIFLAIFLLGAEAVARVAAYCVYDFNPFYLCYGFYSATGDDGGGGFTDGRPGYFKFPAHTTIKHGVPEACRINNHGMRGQDFATKKEPGTFRVVCMGASSTFGFTNRDGGTYPHYLQKLFDEDGLSPKVEVINAGIPNMRARNIVAMYENEIVEYEPDLVTYYEGYNDAHDIANESRFQKTTRWFDEHSVAYAGIRKGVNRVLGPVLAAWWELPHVDAKEAERQAQVRSDEVTTLVTRLIEKAKSHGTDVMLIRQPITLWYDMTARGLVSNEAPRPTYEQQYRTLEQEVKTTGRLQGWQLVLYVHHAILERMAMLEAKYGLDTVDNVSIVDEKPERLASYVHLTEEGNARLAEELHRAIRAAQARKADVPER